MNVINDKPDLLLSPARQCHLQVIIFSFSKRECEDLAQQMVGIDLNSPKEKKLVQGIFENAMDVLAEEDRNLAQVGILGGRPPCRSCWKGSIMSCDEMPEPQGGRKPLCGIPMAAFQSGIYRHNQLSVSVTQIDHFA